MQTYSTTSTSGTLDDLILSCSNVVKSMAWRFVKNKSSMDFEELYSIGMVAACEAATTVDLSVPEPEKYLCRAAHFRMIDAYEESCGITPVSLDAPLPSHEFGISMVSLADVIPTPAAPATQTSPSPRVQALYAAIDRLTPRQRSVVVRRYGLENYGAHNRKEAAAALGMTLWAVKGMSCTGVKNLGRDEQLRKVVGVTR
jgi:RNA polymerase sigma factor (sigma-70 family)